MDAEKLETALMGTLAALVAVAVGGSVIFAVTAFFIMLGMVCLRATGLV